MDAPDPWPVVSLKGDLSQIDREIGEGLERHGLISLVDHGLPPIFEGSHGMLCAIAGLVLEHLERYLGEHRSALSESMQHAETSYFVGGYANEKELSFLDEGRFSVSLLTIFVRTTSSGTILVKSGDMLEEWSRGQIRSVPQPALTGVDGTLYLQPGPDIILRLMPRLTVKKYIADRLPAFAAWNT